MPKAIISGASQGIGRAVALKLAREGFDLAINARREAPLQVLVKQLQALRPEGVFLSRPTDMSVKEEVQAFAEYVLQKWPEVDMLVNNAGVFMPGRVHDEPDGQMEQVLQTNLHSAYYLTRALVPAMKAAGRGHIFNMCSTASITAYENGGAYCIAKHALYGMHKVLRKEMIPYNVRVTALLPGPTYTASWEGVDLPQDRFMRAEDIADSLWHAYQLSDRTVVEDIVLRPQEGDL